MLKDPKPPMILGNNITDDVSQRIRKMYLSPSVLNLQSDPKITSMAHSIDENLESIGPLITQHCMNVQ